MKLRSLIATVFAAGLLVAVSAPAAAAEPITDPKKLEALAESADTSRDHAFVAKQYRLRAELFEEQAKKHEAKAAELKSGPQIGIAAKWPAMAQKTWQKERQLAMQARRAAEESYARADRHYRLSVETELVGQ